MDYFGQRQQGPGLTVLQGYEGANQAQRAAQEHALRQGMSGLQLVDAIQRMQRRRAMEGALADYDADPEQAVGALVRLGEIDTAAKLDKFRGDRDFRTKMRGALSPDGTLDMQRALPLLMEHSPAHGIQYATKAAERAEGRKAVGALAGVPAASMGGTSPGSVSPSSEQGRMLAEQFPDDPHANFMAVDEGLRSVAPGKPGVFDAYVNHPDPIVRNAAINGAQSLAMMTDPERAATHTRTVMDSIARHLDRLDTRRDRSEQREADRELRREFLLSRGTQQDTALVKNMDFLQRSGIARNADEAFKMLHTAAGKDPKQAKLDLAQTMFKAAPWRYQNKFENAFEEAKKFYDSMHGSPTAMGATGSGTPMPGAGGGTGMEGSFAESAGGTFDTFSGPALGGSGPSVPSPRTAAQPGYRQIGREKGTGRPVFEGPDGKRYVQGQ